MKDSKPCLAALICTLAAAATASASEITFIEVAPAAGVSGYAHSFNVHRYPRFLALNQGSLTDPLEFPDILPGPGNPHGFPGVMIFDFDGDGDEDLYVTNGGGVANSLYANQLSESGSLRFVDVAAAAGIDATDMESAGTCGADIDNDGDIDVVVVGDEQPHRLYENNGDGTFTDRTATAGLGGGGISAMSCSFGDLDLDGLVDLAIVHAYDLNTIEWCLIPTFDGFLGAEANEMFRNLGGGTFADIQSASGADQLGGYPPGIDVPGASWSGAWVDYDLDGDVDLMSADDNCAAANGANGGIDRGFLQIWDNDGAGNLTNVTVARGTNIAGAWMSLSYADFDHDGNMDIFATNLGDHLKPQFGVPSTVPGEGASRWFLGSGGGAAFSSPGVGPLLTTPFGWGSAAEDFDNDGDHDIVFMGGLNVNFGALSDNPGTVLVNDGNGGFTFEPGALGTDHNARQPHGLAVGDLDQDGRVDVVSVSAYDAAPAMPAIPYAAFGIAYGSVFDSFALFYASHFETFPGSGSFVWGGVPFLPGSLSIERNTTNGHAAVSVQPMGGIGLTPRARVNRDGIGAVFTFTPQCGRTAMKPAVSGGSHLSQHSRRIHFGLGEADEGTLEVLWPGGVRNILYGVEAGARLTFPEIPCPYDDPTLDEDDFERCLEDALEDLEEAGVVDEDLAEDLEDSMEEAFEAFREGDGDRDACDEDSDSDSDSDCDSDSDSDSDSR